MIFIL